MYKSTRSLAACHLSDPQSVVVFDRESVLLEQNAEYICEYMNRHNRKNIYAISIKKELTGDARRFLHDRCRIIRENIISARYAYEKPEIVKKFLDERIDKRYLVFITNDLRLFAQASMIPGLIVGNLSDLL